MISCSFISHIARYGLMIVLIMMVISAAMSLKSCQSEEAPIVNACIGIRLTPCDTDLLFDETKQMYTGYTDIEYTFNNCSGTNVEKSAWDFGDGFTSTERHSTHTFSHSGVYQITLEVNSSKSKTVSFNILSGQKTYKVGERTNAISAAPSPENNFYVLGSTETYPNINKKWFIAKFDSELHLISKKDFVSATNITQTPDGGLIASGIGGFGLAEISSSGATLWSKTYSQFASASNFYTKKTPDGGYISIGAAQISMGTDYDVVVKTDANGNIIWSREFSGAYHIKLLGAGKIESVPDGYLFATSRSIATGYSLVIVKIDLNGNIVWEKSHPVAMPSRRPGIIRLSIDNNRIIAGFQGSSFYFFTVEGNFISEAMVPFLSPNDYFVLSSELYFAYVTYRADIGCGRISSEGKVAWTKEFDRRTSLPGCRASGLIWEGDGITIIPINESNIVVVGHRDDTDDYEYQSIFLSKVGVDGSLK